MASYYFAGNRDPAVKAFVILSEGSSIPGDTRMNSFHNLSRMSGVSVLDVYGTDDRVSVMDSVIKRRSLGLDRHGNHYTSLAIKGAGHFYRGTETKLVDAFSDWINREVAQ